MYLNHFDLYLLSNLTMYYLTFIYLDKKAYKKAYI